MITDEMVQKLYRECCAPYPDSTREPDVRTSQFIRGVTPKLWKNNPHPCGCQRHLAVFKLFRVIPEYCFNCYKILIVPRTVVELFKLMMVFEQIKLPDDNSRKCMIE